MRRTTLAAAGAFVLGVLTSGQTATAPPAVVNSSVRPIGWTDVAPLRARLEQHGLTAASFDAHVEQIRRANARRVRDGDLDHLVFYLLQSTRFTTLAPVEPALSAKVFVESGIVPADVRSRVAALIAALDVSPRDPRLVYFRDLVRATFPNRAERKTGLLNEYKRAMRFLHEKEFVAQRSPRPADAVAELYRTRGLSTDTAVEAGYLVYLGLAVAKSLEPHRRIRRVLVVGPGLDLAPRTSFREAGPPQSYQPWAVIDALLSLELSNRADLELVAADINPRVVQHIRRSATQAPRLVLASEIQETDTVALTEEYREYFARLGSTIGEVRVESGTSALQKTVQVHPQIARSLVAVQMDVAAERLIAAPFDLVIATNILPYLGEVELMLAMSNIAALLAPGGLFLHNEPRPTLGEMTTLVGLPFEQSRQAIIARVRGARAPLVDTVFLHRRMEKKTGEGEKGER